MKMINYDCKVKTSSKTIMLNSQNLHHYAVNLQLYELQNVTQLKYFALNTKVSKYIAFTLAFVVLISSIGIAQVHHICQMAIAGMEQESCNDSGSSLHDCCAQINIQGEHAENNCCSNEVTYFQNKINTVVQESLKLTIYITVAENFQLYSFRDLENSLENFSFFEYSNLFSTGNNPVYINIQSFLI